MIIVNYFNIRSVLSAYQPKKIKIRIDLPSSFYIVSFSMAFGTGGFGYSA
tara:strand:- start:9270 stop:9419 length:150 start_codon:yes stop_codon:yes gene_type:complete